MELWAVVENGAPLERIEEPDPRPAGTEVVIEVTHCGVCHSDLHFCKGEYDMGGGTVMRITDRGVTLPRAPGHEIVGRVAALGPEAEWVALGDLRIVYPWIGCGTCRRCRAGEDNLCDRQRSIGVVRHGGFGSHVVVPHPRYLVDPGEVDPGLAATFACSGITVLSAIRKLGPLDPDEPVLLIGAGGLGHAAIATLRALGHRAIVVVDLSAEKREAALMAGATAAVDGAAEDPAAAIRDACGGPVMAAIDFVNVSRTAPYALDSLAKGGTLVLIGASGGEMPLSLAGMVFRPRTVMGSAMGSLQDLHDVVALARSGRLAPMPLCRMPKTEANEALALLREGRVTGRIILEGRPNGSERSMSPNQ